MNKRIIIGTALAVIAIATLISFQVTTEAKPVAQCNGQCSNPSCAAANGGECDCQQCTGNLCTTGSCGGNCAEPTCGAKVGKACGCGS